MSPEKLQSLMVSSKLLWLGHLLIEYFDDYWQR